MLKNIFYYFVFPEPTHKNYDHLDRYIDTYIYTHTLILNLVEMKLDLGIRRVYVQENGWDGYQIYETAPRSINKNWKATC